ncbi:MAG TPA: type IV secretion system protein [Solirubrobacteraceae bacterium]|jgi:hypothetical protein|nr:type IV secretion system protein [Solirubrobacteraceae bacterium]
MPGAAAPSGETAPRGERDPLVGNGLTSPLCESGPAQGRLARVAAADCETSGFLAAPAPTGDYALDVHIDTGLFGLSEGGLLSAIQDLLIEPPWMGLVWAVHALVAMLQWAFTIDLLDSAGSGLGAGLRGMQASLTTPWLAFVLAVAAVLLGYNGLVRRRVAETLGHAVAMLAMIAGSLWVIANPTGSAGALASWADGASLGALAVAATGSPAEPREALSAGMAATFATAVEGPWCYLEFGDVAWCREPRYLDARLRAAGLAIASSEQRSAGCGEDPAVLHGCGPAGSRSKALQLSARLLRSARTNADLFLALPANGGDRNSINREGSLLRTLCQSSDAAHCHGQTAAQAEFRTNSGTWARLGGLAMILAGALGMLLLIGFICVRLLTAALMGLGLLLLAPAVALAPAFGERGRELFRRWILSLLGALLAKLVFAFLLGVVLAIDGILSRLQAFGWWTDWLLTSAFWWTAFARRHHALGLLGPRSQPPPPRRGASRRAREAIEIPRRLLRDRSRASDSARRPSTGGEGGTEPGLPPATAMSGAPGGERSDGVLRRGSVAGQAVESRRSGRPGAGADVDVEEELVTDGEREPVTEGERERAPAHGPSAVHSADRAREPAASVAERGEVPRAVERAAARPAHGGRAPGGERVERGAPPPRRGGRDAGREDELAFLVHQATLPAGGGRSREGERRDYTRLARLVGYAPEVYTALPAQRARAVDAAVDAELAQRQESLTRILRRSASDGGETPPDGGSDDRAFERPRPQRRPPADVDPMMADAREVEAGRKRQLGFDYD